MKIDVLGTVYDVVVLDYKNDAWFEKNNSCGYCDDVEKRIVICNMQTFLQALQFQNEMFRQFHIVVIL